MCEEEAAMLKIDIAGFGKEEEDEQD